MNDDDLEELKSVEAIKHVLNDYALGMDLRIPERWLSAWHPDGMFEQTSVAGGASSTSTGHTELVEAAREAWSKYKLFVHLTGNHSILFDGPDKASGDGHTSVIGALVDETFVLCGAVYSDRYERRVRYMASRVPSGRSGRVH